MSPNLDSQHSAPLDLLTLAAVRDQVTALLADRSAAERRCQALADAHPGEGWAEPLVALRAGAVEALTALILSLDAQIEEADAALDRWAVTEAGRRALAATEAA